MDASNRSCQVCIVGGGPAGLVLGLLLSRAGIKTIVLEKHADFFRDFRGDTVHPSTLEIFHELGLVKKLLQRPHQKADQVTAVIGGEEVAIADFSHLSVSQRYIAFMPQWDFLDFVREVAQESANFDLMMQAVAYDLIQEADDSKKAGRILGVRVKSDKHEFEVRADLVVACDGRHSALRSKANLPLRDLGAPIDVLWMRISRLTSDPPQLFGRFEQGRIFVMLNRQDYWQCGFVISKGSFDTIRAHGLTAFQNEIASIAPLLGERVKELDDWDKIKLLTVRVDRLEQWARDGLLLIGDAAHAMSPVGGVGINLAIQDAVAAANLLVGPLQKGRCTLTDLRRVQARRMLPTRLTQSAQVLAHKRVLVRVLTKSERLKPPLFLQLLKVFPWLRRIPARLIGVGIRPEHPDPKIFQNAFASSK